MQSRKTKNQICAFCWQLRRWVNAGAQMTDSPAVVKHCGFCSAQDSIFNFRETDDPVPIGYSRYKSVMQQTTSMDMMRVCNTVLLIIKFQPHIEKTTHDKVFSAQCDLIIWCVIIVRKSANKIVKQEKFVIAAMATSNALEYIQRKHIPHNIICIYIACSCAMPWKKNEIQISFYIIIYIT